jgi:hypothetical protein
MAKQQSNYTVRARETCRQGEMLAPITTRHHSWQRWWRQEVGGEVVVARQMTTEWLLLPLEGGIEFVSGRCSNHGIITTVKATADAAVDSWKEATIGEGNANNLSYYLLILITTTTTEKQKNFNIINYYF